MLLPWLPLIVLLATMPVFAVRVRHRPPDANVAARPASALFGYWVRNWMIWVLSPLERALVRGRVSPDLLNYAGLALGVLAGAAFIARQLPLAGWTIALGGICDILDGRVARARGMSSAYGKFLDSTLDRFAETFTFVGVAWYLSGTAWLAVATLVALGGSMLVSYTRARGETVGASFAGGLAQRAERVVVLAIATLLEPTVPGALAWSVVAIALASLGTAIYRTVVIARALRTGSPAPP
jgi:CDP-diacylglycerol--glycerol-3-phosphate 3-phosphatidyltransferase